MKSWVTYTGLEFKEQWSTIISGRKSSLKEAILTKKSSLFSFKIMSLNRQLDQRLAVNSRLHTSNTVLRVRGEKGGTDRGWTEDQNCVSQETDPHGNPIHWSTKHSKQSLAEELGAALEARGAQVTDTKWQVFRLSRFWDWDEPLACRW